MAKQNGVRLNTMVSERTNKLLDEYSSRYGVSKSSMVAFAVGQYVDYLDFKDDCLEPSIYGQGFVHLLRSDIDEIDHEK